MAAMGLILELTNPISDDARVMNPSVYSDRPVVETCNFAVRRSVLLDVGGFDEGLPPYGLDDAELAIRLRRAGHEITSVPEMRIYARQTEGLRKRVRKVYSSAKGEIYVWKKHEDMFRSNLTWRYILGESIQAVRLILRYATGDRTVPRETVARRMVTSLGHAVAFSRH